jgi:alpha-glucosidase
VLYQIYPRSFADADGDGVGDLAGITAHLDYVRDLGVDAIWFSPIFPSPMADFGYDVADYVDIEPLFGTLADFDALVAAAGARGLRVLLDLVPNHSSDEHPWFIESRSSRTNAKRDWYVWRDPGPDGGVPNNWRSHFGGSAWEFDATTGQYYLHLFHAKQPDLNWRNPAVREAMYDVMRFWFARGVDGFRIDVVWMLIKDETFADNPPPRPREGPQDWARYDNPGYEDRPEVHEIIREMRAVADEFDDRVLIGELYLPIERLVRYYGDDLRGLQMPFNFGLVTLPAWDAAAIRSMIDRYLGALPPGAWPNWVLGNHDVPRIATRSVGAGARVAMMLLLTLPGTPTCYYGDELGLPQAEIPPELEVDPQARTGAGRDGARTPMPWTDAPQAGFTAPGVRPWLPVPESHRSRAVQVEAADPHSDLAVFRALVRLHKLVPALRLGTYAAIGDDDRVLAYVREIEGERVLVALDLSAAGATVDLSSVAPRGEVLVATHTDRVGGVDLDALALRPGEGVVFSV